MPARTRTPVLPRLQRPGLQQGIEPRARAPLAMCLLAGAPTAGSAASPSASCRSPVLERRCGRTSFIVEDDQEPRLLVERLVQAVNTAQRQSPAAVAIRRRGRRRRGQPPVAGGPSSLGSVA